LRTLARKRQCDGAGTRAEISDSRGSLSPQRQRALDEQFRLRTRNQNSGIHREPEGPKVPIAHDIGDGFSCGAAAYEGCVLVRLLGGDGMFGVSY